MSARQKVGGMPGDGGRNTFDDAIHPKFDNSINRKPFGYSTISNTNRAMLPACRSRSLIQGCTHCLRKL